MTRGTRETISKKGLLILFALVLTTILYGCVDARMRRAASLVNVKTQTDATEFSTVKTDAEKIVVAKRHFESLPKFTQVLDDYCHGKQPTGPIPEPAK